MTKTSLKSQYIRTNIQNKSKGKCVQVEVNELQQA